MRMQSEEKIGNNDCTGRKIVEKMIKWQSQHYHRLSPVCLGKVDRVESSFCCCSLLSTSLYVTSVGGVVVATLAERTSQMDKH